MSDGSESRRRDRGHSGNALGRKLVALSASAGSHVDDLVAGYALGALDQAERLQVERHRRVCAACDRLLMDELPVVGLLPFAVATAPPPPPDLKPALLARVAHAQRAAAADRLPASRLAAWGRTPTLPSDQSSDQPATVPNAVDRQRPPSRLLQWSNRASVALALPLLLALVATAVWAVQLRAEADADQRRAESFGTILEGALAQDGDVVQLAAGPAAPELKGWVVSSGDGGGGTLYVRGAAFRAGSRFELFGSGAGGLVPLAEFTLDDRGRGIVPFPLDRPPTDYRQFRVKAMGDDGWTGLALWGRPAGLGGTPIPSQNAVAPPAPPEETPAA